MSWRSKIAALGIAASLPLVSHYEGLYRTTYLDPVGIPTICYGHTGPEVVPGLTYTREQCDELLARDLAIATQSMQSCVTVPLTDNQRSAFTSFVFNVGPGVTGRKDGFCRLASGKPSTMLRLLNAGQYSAACAELRKWDKAGGRVLPGLTKRRKAEYDLCVAP